MVNRPDSLLLRVLDADQNLIVLSGCAREKEAGESGAGGGQFESKGKKGVKVILKK